jgi:cytochrome c biogenesis protein CcmG, thiol:disulfide interchange protein DsbE
MLLPTLAGSSKSSLAAYRGKVVILNFWASWCTPCEYEAPAMERLQRQLAGHDATVLGVAYEDVIEDSLKFVHQFGLTYPNLRDVTGSFAHSYGTVQIPESFVIDRNGDVAEISRGEVTKPFLEFAVQLAKHS